MCCSCWKSCSDFVEENMEEFRSVLKPSQTWDFLHVLSGTFGIKLATWVLLWAHGHTWLWSFLAASPEVSYSLPCHQCCFLVFCGINGSTVLHPASYFFFFFFFHGNSSWSSSSRTMEGQERREKENSLLLWDVVLWPGLCSKRKAGNLAKNHKLETEKPTQTLILRFLLFIYHELCNNISNG